MRLGFDPSDTMTDPRESPSIAVVIATHQAERHLAPQLQSLTEQTTRPTSVIVSDAGSTDRTLEIAEEFADRAPFPVLIRRHAAGDENLLSAALLATTELVALCGQADVWLPSKLATITRAFARREVQMAAHAALLVDARGRRRGKYTQGIVADRDLAPLTLDPWGRFAAFTITFRRPLLDVIAFDRRLLGRALPERTMQAEDWVYFLASCLGDTALRATPLALHRSAPPRWGLWLRLTSAVERQRTLRLSSERRCEVARARASLLSEAAESARSTDAQRPLLEAAARHWTRVARCEENRLALYHKPSLEQRFDKLLRNVADGTYRHVPRGGFRHTELARDLLSLWVPP